MLEVKTVVLLSVYSGWMFNNDYEEIKKVYNYLEGTTDENINCGKLTEKYKSYFDVIFDFNKYFKDFIIPNNRNKIEDEMIKVIEFAESELGKSIIINRPQII